MSLVNLNLEESLNFVISKDRFVKSLHGPCSIAGRKTIEGFVANVSLHSVDGKLIISGSNNEISVTCCMDCAIQKEGSAFVMANMLFEIVRKIPDEENISVSVFSPASSSIEQGFLQISCSSSVFKLPLSSKDEHSLTWNEDDYDDEIVLNVADINTIFSKVLFASSADLTRKFINSIFIDIDVLINVVATDGHRLAAISYKQPEEEAYEKKINFILPRKAVSEVLKILSSCEEQEKVKIFISDRKIAIKADSLAMVVVKIDAEYPDYKSVIKSFENDEVKRFSLDLEVFKAALDRVSAVIVDKVKAVDLKLSKGKLEIVCQSHGFGSFASEVIGLDYSGEDAELFLNARYILDVLDRMDSTSVTCVFKNSDDPVLFLDNALEGYKYVVMPMVRDH